MEHKEASQGDFESTLKKHARQFVESLEKGQFGDAVQLIHELNQTRDRGLYQRSRQAHARAAQCDRQFPD
jgi:chemotaxis protein CheZ